MTSRSKNAARSYETEIEKNREESNWKKAVELAQQLKSRSPQHESLAHFLIGEGKLEAYLDEWPPIKENIERAQRELSEARGYLTLATDESGKRAGVALDAHLLLGKLNYACGAYDDSLKQYNLAELSTLTEKELPVRSLRIVAESYAIKGLCLELNAIPASSSRFKQAERESEMIRSFELASELTLLYLQRAQAARAGVVLETALQRAPLLHIRAGRLHSAIDRYREMLTAVESVSTQALRLTLARQLAEVLLRGVTGQVYKAPEKLAVMPQQGTLTRRREDHVSEGPWKPKKYAAINQFVPRNEYEEAMLVLLVGEAMAVRDAVLSQSAEFEAARAHSLRNAVALVDLLALAAVRWGQMALLLEVRALNEGGSPARRTQRRSKVAAGEPRYLPDTKSTSIVLAMPFELLTRTGETSTHPPDDPTSIILAVLLAVSLERAMKFSFGCAHVWRARALAAAARPHHAHKHAPPGQGALGGHVRALGVARRAAQLCRDDTPLRLVAAANCFRAGWIEEGIEMADEALAIEVERKGPMLARCYLYSGIGHQMRAQKTNSRIEKEAANELSLRQLLRSVELDDNDHLAFYHLALQYMHVGMLNEAMDATRACLAVRAECGGALRVAAALWACAGAGRRAGRALHAARLARHHYPHAEWPLWALAALQLLWEGGDGGGYHLKSDELPSSHIKEMRLDDEEFSLPEQAALATGKELLKLLNSAETESDADHNGYAELDALSDSQDDTQSNRDAASIRAESAGAFRAERALSDVGGAGSGGAGGGAGGGGTAGGAHSPLQHHRAHAWLLLADLCLSAPVYHRDLVCCPENFSVLRKAARTISTQSRHSLELGDLVP
ncbi:unnamed protein product, partial [Iphiclides podalirius]